MTAPMLTSLLLPLVLLAVAPGASGQDPPTSEVAEEPRRAEVILRDGRRVAALRASVSADGRAVELASADGGRSRVVPVEEVAAILFSPAGGAPSDAPGMLEMQDGERLPGRLERAEEGVAWVHPWLGAMPVDLDRVRRLEIERPPRPRQGAAGGDAAPADADLVLLANGDAVAGLVAEVSIDVLVEPLDGGEPRRVPLERVRSIELARRPAAPGAIRLWTADGTVLDAESLRASGRDLLALRREGTAAASTRETTLFLREIDAVAWRPASILPLATRPVEVSALAAEDSRPPRSWLPGPRIGVDGALDAPPIELSGPARFAFAVPAGAVLSAVALLPEPMRRFGDLELVAFDGGREVLRRRFSGSDPGAELIVPCASGVLVLELREGRHGPVQDVLRLLGAVVVLPR